MPWLVEIKGWASLVLLSFPFYIAFVLNCINLTNISSPKFAQSGKDNFSWGMWLFFGAHGLQVFCGPRHSQQAVYSVYSMERNNPYSESSTTVVASAMCPQVEKDWINTMAKGYQPTSLVFLTKLSQPKLTQVSDPLTKLSTILCW